MYALIQGNTVVTFPYSEVQFRRDNPHTSFPRTLSLPVDGLTGTLVGVEYTARPATLVTQVAIPNAAPSLLGGMWVIDWTVRAKTPEEVAFDATLARTERDQLIADTDWMALSDKTLTPAWATYRQALRDITNHVNFPYLTDADWPTKP